MISAIGYSINLALQWNTKVISKVTSFFSGGILFYTIYAGTTLLLLGWFGMYQEEHQPDGLLIFDQAWMYHFLINIAILIMFFTKKDRIEYVLTGIEVFMITSPVMLIIRELTGRELWGDTNRIILYVIVGIVLFIIHRLIALLAKDIYPSILQITRKFIIISMFVYTAFVLAAVPINIGVEKNEVEDRYYNEDYSNDYKN